MASERGQTAPEYLGLLLVVAAVIAAIAASDIASTIRGTVGQQICRLAADGECDETTAAADGQRGIVELPEQQGGAAGAPSGARGPSLDLGQARVASRAVGQPLMLRPAVAQGGAQTCFASTHDPCVAPGGAYEFAPPEPTPGEELDQFLSDTGETAEAWLGWLAGSDPSSPFYDSLAEDRRERHLDTLDDGLAFLERVNRSSGGPALPGRKPSGPGAEARGDLANELLGISELRRAIAAAQDDDDLRAMGHLGFALPFFRGGAAAREGIEEAAEETTEQGVKRQGNDLPRLAGGTPVTSIRGRVKQAMLPASGRIRYVPPKRYNSNDPLPQGDHGYLDRFGNEWVRGPSRTQGESFEWDVQLSEAGRRQLGWLSRDGRHINVNREGQVTHR